MSDEDDKKAWKDFIENVAIYKGEQDDAREKILKERGVLNERKNHRNLPLPAPLTKKLVKKLTTRKLNLAASLDLHGTDRVSAREKFIIFVKSCCDKNYKYVLVITGKGKGLIKKALPLWIEEEQIFPLIVGYSHAHRLQGGEGAFILHLRKK